MKKSVDELLEESRALRFNFKKLPEPVANFEVVTQPALPWHYFTAQFLARKDTTFIPVGIWNVYPGEVIPPNMPGTVLVIIHGHSPVGEFCGAKTLCHDQEYKLPADCPQIIKERWEKLYAVREHSVSE